MRFIFPLQRYKVFGDSMIPTLKEGNEVICYRWAYSKNPPKVGDLVVAKVKDLEIIKRVMLVRDDEVYLKGDNEHQSTDSRNFGWINNRQIVGKAVWTLKK
jgi:nickel-type superoxide dismutase maturation protease